MEASKASVKFEFETGAALMNHVEKRHLIPFAWHVGDGPQNTVKTTKKKKSKTKKGNKSDKRREEKDEKEAKNGEDGDKDDGTDSESVSGEDEKEEEEEEEELPSYLFGPDGKQVTPSIRDQEVEDIVTWKKNRRKLKDLLMRVEANAPTESDSEDENKGQQGADAATVAPPT